jgi:hypothetical protein
MKPSRQAAAVFRLYDPDMSSSILLRREMLLLAEEALEGDFITPFYNPKLTSRRVMWLASKPCCVAPPPANQCMAPNEWRRHSMIRD